MRLKKHSSWQTTKARNMNSLDRSEKGTVRGKFRIGKLARPDLCVAMFVCTSTLRLVLSHKSVWRHENQHCKGVSCHATAQDSARSKHHYETHEYNQS